MASIAFPHFCRPAWKKWGRLCVWLSLDQHYFLRVASRFVICILSVNDATLTLVVAQPLLAQSIYSIFHSSCGPSRIVAMALMGLRRSSLWSVSSKHLAWENLAIDPNRVLLPLKLPKDLPLEPTIEQFWQYRTGWEAPFDEEYEYRILLPEPAFSRVWEHCLKAFPTRIVSFSGPGRVVGVDLVIKPISLVDVTYRLWTQMHELDDTRLRIKALERSLEMITHNVAVLTKTLVSVHPDLVDEMHPNTPPSWISPPEEY